MQYEPINVVAINPKVRSGRPYIVGTTICVSDVITLMRYQQFSVDEVAQAYTLTLEQVHGALAYYYGHQAAIDAEIQRRAAVADEYKEKRIGSRHPSLLGREHADGDSGTAQETRD